jgi:hypothetical protein
MINDGESIGIRTIIEMLSLEASRQALLGLLEKLQKTNRIIALDFRVTITDAAIYAKHMKAIGETEPK